MTDRLNGFIRFLAKMDQSEHYRKNTHRDSKRGHFCFLREVLFFTTTVEQEPYNHESIVQKRLQHKAEAKAYDRSNSLPSDLTPIVHHHAHTFAHENNPSSGGCTFIFLTNVKCELSHRSFSRKIHWKLPPRGRNSKNTGLPLRSSYT